MRSDISDGFGMPGLVKAGYVDSWLPDHVKKWPQQYFDPKGFWTSTNFFVLAPGYNTETIKRGTEPRSYEALLDPRLKGKMAWSSRASASSAVGFVGHALTLMVVARIHWQALKLAFKRVPFFSNPQPPERFVTR